MLVPLRHLQSTAKRVIRPLLCSILVLCAGLAKGQITNYSREVSLFNFGQPTASIEAISREMSLFGRTNLWYEGISREASVFDYGYNQLSLTVGSTGVLAGATSSVPILFWTFAPVTNVFITVDFPANRLTGWDVQPQSPLSGSLVVSSNSRLYLTFSPGSGQTITNAQVLGQIRFAAPNSFPSAFLPLVGDVQAQMLNGEFDTPFKTNQNGEVIVINGNSLLRRSTGTNGLEYLTLYGLSGVNYTIESATNLRPPVSWSTFLTNVVPTNLIATTPYYGLTNWTTFLRAKQ